MSVQSGVCIFLKRSTLRFGTTYTKGWIRYIVRVFAAHQKLVQRASDNRTILRYMIIITVCILYRDGRRHYDNIVTLLYSHYTRCRCSFIFGLRLFF